MPSHGFARHTPMAYVQSGAFVETPVFTARLSGYLEDDEYRELQLALILRPEGGAVVRGSGGLRKLRWGVHERGKRGGLRVLYYWHPADQMFYMLLIYEKNEQKDLTLSQLRVLRRLIQEEFK